MTVAKSNKNKFESMASQDNSPIGDPSRYYNEDELKDFKEKLEVEYQARLSRTKPSGKYMLLCKSKGCDFLFQFDEITENSYRLVKSNANHSCNSFLATDQLAFFKNRKKVIDMKETLYKVMKQRCYKHNFEKPKLLLTIIAKQYEYNSSDLLYGDVENLEDRRRIKKKFDNLVGETKNRILDEDPKLRIKLLAEKRDAKKKRNTHKKRLTGVGMSDEESNEQVVPRARKSDRRRIIQKHELKSTQLKPSPQTLLKCERKPLPPPSISDVMEVQNDSYYIPDPPSSSHKVEYDLREDSHQESLVHLKKDFLRKDGTKVTDLYEWRKVNMRMAERQERAYRRRQLHELQDDD